MERAAFLIDATGERIDCLLNPEGLEVSRLAGVRARGTGTGRLPGAGMADDPIHLTGGGRTQLQLDLLFDVDLVEGRTVPRDVRALTRRLWQLAENVTEERGTVRPPLVRFVWGKTWNIPGVVAAVAERFDRFDPAGAPQRSWLRLRLLRVAPTAEHAGDEFDAMLSEARAAQHTEAAAAMAGPAGTRAAVVVTGSGREGASGAPEPVRFDLLATDALGSPFLWRLLADHNDVADPLRVAPGTVLEVPEVDRARAPVRPGAPTAGDAA